MPKRGRLRERFPEWLWRRSLKTCGDRKTHSLRSSWRDVLWRRADSGNEVHVSETDPRAPSSPASHACNSHCATRKQNGFRPCRRRCPEAGGHALWRAATWLNHAEDPLARAMVLVVCPVPDGSCASGSNPRGLPLSGREVAFHDIDHPNRPPAVHFSGNAV